MEIVLARRIIVNEEIHNLQYVQIERDSEGRIRSLKLSDFDSERPNIRYIAGTLRAIRLPDGSWELSPE